MDRQYIIPTSLVLITAVIKVQPVRVWQTVYMDKENCDSYVRNDDMTEGDVYVVKSDSYRGSSPWARRPAECSTRFNLGERMVAVNLVEWWCDQSFPDPYLEVYDDCHTNKEKLLARYNCSSSPPGTLLTSGSCVSLYHYRGHTRWGYFFALEITARHELMAFPAGGIAAIVIVSIVAMMLCVKIVCVLTGWENKFPELDSMEDDEQSILPRQASNASEPASPIFGGTQDTATAFMGVSSSASAASVSSSLVGASAASGSAGVIANDNAIAVDASRLTPPPRPRQTMVSARTRGHPVVTFADDIVDNSITSPTEETPLRNSSYVGVGRYSACKKQRPDSKSNWKLYEKV